MEADAATAAIAELQLEATEHCTRDRTQRAQECRAEMERLVESKRAAEAEARLNTKLASDAQLRAAEGEAGMYTRMSTCKSWQVSLECVRIYVCRRSNLSRYHLLETLARMLPCNNISALGAV